MKFNKTIILKDNTECVIRNGMAEDAQAVCDLFVITHEETDFLLSYPDESFHTLQQEEEFLQEKENSEKEIFLCAFVNGELAGTAGVYLCGAKDKVKHRASFGISIIKKYWGKGIGKALMLNCIEFAKKQGIVNWS